MMTLGEVGEAVLWGCWGCWGCGVLKGSLSLRPNIIVIINTGAYPDAHKRRAHQILTLGKKVIHSVKCVARSSSPSICACTLRIMLDMHTSKHTNTLQNVNMSKDYGEIRFGRVLLRLRNFCQCNPKRKCNKSLVIVALFTSHASCVRLTCSTCVVYVLVHGHDTSMITTAHDYDYCDNVCI